MLSVFQWDLESRKAELLAKGMLTKLMTAGKWSGLEDLTNLYKFDHTFPEPRVSFHIYIYIFYLLNSF